MAEEVVETPAVQESSASPTVNATVPVTTVPPAAAAEAAAPAAAAAPAPPQAEQAPKGNNVQARINQLIARAKLDEEALDAANAEIARLKAAGTSVPASSSENPYAPPAPVAEEEVSEEDLDGLPPVVRKLVIDHQREVKDRARNEKLSELEAAIGKGFEQYPEVEGAVDDNAIILEMKTRRLPVFNADLVFAAQSLPVVRNQRDAALKRVAELEAELNKDTVAAPVNSSNKPAPPDGTEREYAPGEKMAEARRKAAGQY